MVSTPNDLLSFLDEDSMDSSDLRVFKLSTLLTKIENYFYVLLTFSESW